jgi:glycosyltransferase involved in cell wall biosynthesis
LKVCLFSRHDPFQTFGGIETYLQYLTQYLTEWGHEVVLARPVGTRGQAARAIVWATLKTLRIDVSEMYDSFKVALDVSKIDADVYHAQAQHGFAFGAIRRVGTRSKKPLISTAHGSAWGLMHSCPWSNATTKLVRANMERAAFNASDAVISVSNSTRSEVVKGYGVNPDRARVIHNGVDPKRYLSKSLGKFELHGSEDQFVITFFARGGIRKGAHTSARILQALCPEIGLSDRIMIQAVVDERSFPHFSSICIPRGWSLYKNPEESLMLKLLSASDILIFPTPYEGHSFTVLEAMAARNVVLTSSIPPNIETVENGVSGYTLDPTDTERWVHCILNLYADERARRDIQENASRRVQENFLAEVMCKRTLQLYESAS